MMLTIDAFDKTNKHRTTLEQHESKSFSQQ